MSLLMSLGAAAEGPPGRSGRAAGRASRARVPGELGGRAGGTGQGCPGNRAAVPGGGRAVPAAGAEGGGRRLLQNSLEAKDGSGSAHAGIAPAAAYYPYDHTLSQYQYDR